jgi:hypothetical protein
VVAVVALGWRGLAVDCKSLLLCHLK